MTLSRIDRVQIEQVYALFSRHPIEQARSILNYSEVKIRQHNLPLWLPTDVEASWQIGDATGNETHRYSNYRLFEATTTILPARANPTP